MKFVVTAVSWGILLASCASAESANQGQSSPSTLPTLGSGKTNGVVDSTKLGAACSDNSECKRGEECAIFADLGVPQTGRCVSMPAAAVVTCSDSTPVATQTTGDPVVVQCQAGRLGADAGND